MPSKPMIERSKRGPFDDISTPPWVTRTIMPFIAHEAIIWEAAPGAGVMVDTFEENGWTVVQRGGRDSLRYEPRKPWDILVTNPPYSQKHLWLERCHYLLKPWILLLPVATLGVRRCHPFLKDCEIIFLPRRVDFTGGKRPWHSVAWFTGRLNLGRQLTFLED